MRIRVFAGPNGSGKSTVIEYVKNYKSNGRGIDFGHYINADDIALSLRSKWLSFERYDISATDEEFRIIALASGLVNERFLKIVLHQAIPCETMC